MAATPDGMKEIARRQREAASRATQQDAEAARKAALTEEERKAESDRESEKLKRRNARLGKWDGKESESDRIRRAD
ncbi:MAG: hypothetical protein PHS46_07875 [Candidatus Omnitrophica bacterium]|nr:hypothetical protein [Candidatus Omnitrophota bacterium]